MRMIELELRPTPARLRQFGVAAALFCGLLGLMVWWRGHLLFWDVSAARGQALTWLGGVGIAAALVGFAFPRALWPLYVLLSLIALPIGTVLSYTLLALLFYGLLTPLGLWFRMRGRDPLDRRARAHRDSQWHPVRRARQSKDYFRQF